MVRTVERELGPIDILVNNAGMANPKGIEDITEEDWDETISVNLKSAFLMIQAVLSGMRERRWGRIINITSGAAHTGGIIGPHYSASKAGMEGLTRAYAARLVKEGITVNAVAPGFIKTRMTDVLSEEIKKKLAEQIPLARLGEVEDIARAVLFLSSDAASYITGQVLAVNGGMYM